MVNCQVKMMGKDAGNSSVNMNFIQTEVNIVNRFSRFMIGHFQQSIKS